jgi:hypothetical protein
MITHPPARRREYFTAFSIRPKAEIILKCIFQTDFRPERYTGHSKTKGGAFMAAQMIFQRVEKKYLLTPSQYDALRRILLRYMKPDAYGSYTICNLYYDTPDYALVRASLQKPVYKEKLRLRSYGVPQADSTVFPEIKKKYKGIVYKRRAEMTLAQAEQYLATGMYAGPRSQVLKEMDYFLAMYQPEPKVFLAYDREALYAAGDPELRMTFDTNIRWRTEQLDLAAGDAGAPLSVQGKYLMEVKIPDAFPLWLARALCLLDIYPVSFSKYGCCYSEQLCRTAVRSAQKETGSVYCA